MAKEYLVAFNTKTSAYINDFQSDVKQEALIENAAASGVSAADIRIDKVSAEKFISIEASVNSSARTAAEQARAAVLAAAFVTLDAVAKKCGVTNEALIQMIQVYG